MKLLWRYQQTWLFFMVLTGLIFQLAGEFALLNADWRNEIIFLLQNFFEADGTGAP